MRVTFAVPAMALCIASGCTAPVQRDRFEGSDTASFPTVRAFIDVSHFEEGDVPKSQTEAEGTEDGPQYRVGMDINLTGTDGSFVPDGQVAEAEYTMIEASVGARGGVVIEERLTLDLIGGLGYHYGDFAGPGRFGPISEREHGLGLLFGTQVTWEPIDNIQLYGRATYLPMFTEAVSAQAEAGVQVNVVDELGLLVAYRWWEFKTTHESGSDPEIDVELTGVVFGMVLQF